MAVPAEPTAPADHTVIVEFLSACHATIADLVVDRSADDPHRLGADALHAALVDASPRPYEPADVPVLATIDQLALDEVSDPHGVGPGFVGLAPSLAWVPTRRATDGGTELALAPLDLALDLGSTTVGLMYIGPGATYPLHHHPPQELYLTIAGTGSWRYGGNEGHETIGPLRTLYNRPDDLHTATAIDGPLAALYVLW